MPRVTQKRHKGLAKRVKVSARGKVTYKAPNAGHLMSSKGGNRRLRLRRSTTLKHGLVPRILRALLED